MPKLGIGVGEEFPVGDPPAVEPEPERPHRPSGWHIAFHILVRVAAIALVIGLFAWAFHGFGAPYAYQPGVHRHFFFPFFPVLLIVLLIFAFRRRHYYGYRYGCDMRRWHDELHRERGERL
jgi:hypothetical protein